LENIDISSTEDMGLLGIGYFIDINKNYYIGSSVYGAVSGQRGGFFVLGIDGGYKYIINDNFSLDAGLFLGGGGGGSAPQGGGLMVRPHLSLLYDFDDFKLGLGLSSVKFPNGDISSNQIFLQAEVPFDTAYLKGHQFALTPTYNSIRNQLGSSLYSTYMATTIEQYVPLSGTKNLNSNVETKNFQLVGFEYGAYFNKNAFVFIQTAGAAGGDAGGYMEVLSGLGYKYKFKNMPISADARVELGAAGGGNIDTGGGLVTKLKSGLSYDITDTFSLRGDIGYIHSFDGDFKAKTYGVNLFYNVKVPSSKQLQKVKRNLFLNSSPTSVTLTHKSYLQSNTMLSSSSAKTQQIDLIGLKIKKHLNPNLYITGQAYGAYEGDAGGYAEGLVGFGLQSPKFFDQIKLNSEILLGAGAGGGLDTKGGAIAELTAGFSYDLSKSWDVGVNFGKMRSIKKGIDVNTISFDLAYNFSTLNF
jgi:hypothetical protein